MADHAPHDVEHVSRTPFIAGYTVDRYRFGNGLTLLFVRDDSAPVFSYQTWFRVGSRDDTEGITGIAHLFEHMMFKATRNHREGEFMRLLEAAGAPDVNAWTWNDETVYLQSLPAGNLDLITGLEADRMQNLDLNEDTFETERQVVINERRLRVENDPYGLLNERLWSLAFADHPYGRPVIGWRPDLDAIRLDDCREFYRKFYSPSNATLIVVGDLEAEEVVETVGRHYARFPAQEVTRPALTPEAPQDGPRSETIQLEAETEILMVGVKIPETRSPEHVALLTLDRILFGGRSSRLYRKLVDDGLAARASAFLPMFQDPSLYDVTVVLRPGRRASEAQRIILEEFEDLAARPVTDEELTAARNKLKASFFSDFKETRGVADFLGIFEMATSGFEAGLETLEQIDSVDAEAIQEAARRYFTSDRSTSVVGVPSTASGSGPGAHGGSGPLGHRPFFMSAAPRSVTTEGGGRIFVVPEQSPPLVRARVVFNAGTRLDPPGQEGLAHLAARMLIRGTHRRAKENLEIAIDSLGGSLETHAGFERIVVGGESLAETSEALFDLLEEVLVEPSFPEHEIDKLKDETRARLVEVRNNDRALGALFHEAALFGPHPYGRIGMGTSASLDAITREDLIGFHHRYLGERSALAGVAGAVDATHGKERARRLLAALGRKEEGDFEDGDARPVLSGRRLLIVDKPERTQTHVRIGHFGVTVNDPDFPALDLANTVFGGGNFNAILFQEIREKRGWSYGAGSAFKVAREPHSFTMAFSPAVRDTLPAIRLSLQLFERFVADGVDPDALEFARRFTLGASAFDLNTPDKRLKLAMEQVILDYDREQHLEAVRSLTKEQLDDAIRRHFDPANVLVTVVGTADALRDELEKSGDFRSVEVKAYDSVG